MRCGEKEFHNSFLKLFRVFYVGNFWWNHIVYGFESGLVGLEGGDLNNAI